MKILDCTLRDGGYVNDWEFSRDMYDSLIQGLQQVGIDFIEVGMLVQNANCHFTTKFNDFKDIPVPIHVTGADSVFTVMFTYSEAKGIEIPEKSETNVDAVRLAYFKPEADMALELAGTIKAKGYLVFLQAMATFMYTDDELKAMLEKVNRLKPFYFCMVDSFGVMYGDDVQHMYHLADSSLDSGIGIGFHAHNNQQMALSNAIVFMEEAKKTKRETCVDASIYGMGRGAGNVNLELLLHYLNKKQQKQYDVNAVLALWDKYLQRDYCKYFWGYTWEYFVSAMKETNSAYIWYIKRNGIHDMESVARILKALPHEARYSLRRDVIDPLIRKEKEHVACRIN